MIFNKHSNLVGQHAFLGASKYHWINYSEEKLVTTYSNHLAKERGTKLHEFAATCIELGQKLPRSNKTLNMFVNDAIGYKMVPEQILYYSDFCFGTADAISYRNGILRIHDLKTGKEPAHMEQLKIYAALFCLEYRHLFSEIKEVHLAIYQNNAIDACQPELEEIAHIMEIIISSDKTLNKVKNEGGLLS